jgi:predicted Zn-dependent protease
MTKKNGKQIRQDNPGTGFGNAPGNAFCNTSGNAVCNEIRPRAKSLAGQRLALPLSLPLALSLALPLALAMLPSAWAADDPGVQKLVDQARYWQQKKRDDLAAEAWRKLLRFDPENAQALIALGSIEAGLGNEKEAQELYQRAKALKTAPAGLAELETALKVQRAPAADLSAARKQAQTGQTEQAVKSYQNILGETRPAGQFGLEYYQTLGGTPEGWDEARRGLEQLARANPGDARYLLALATHLSYRESTRREGIRQLAHLTQQDPTAKERQKAWRQALVWLGARTPDRALFQQYLNLYANDQAVRERLRQLDRPTAVAQKPNLADIERAAGFRWLDSGDVDKAEARFKTILQKKPQDLDARGGLATVMMRKEQWVEASALLDQVVANGGKRWRGAQQSAHYWTLMHEINEARQSDPNTDISDKLQEALRIDPKASAGLVLLADLVLEKRDFVRAEPLYRQVLKREPQNPGAFLGLISVLSQTGREQEALAMIAQQNFSPELKMVGLNQAKSQALFKLAQTDEQAGNTDMAMQRMEDALLLDPASPWVRLALARLYQRMGDAAGANALIDNLLDSFPDLPEAQHARALLFAEQERPFEALQALDKIAPGRRTAAMAQDQRRLWVQVQVTRARQMQQLGQAQPGATVLAQAQQAAGNDLNLLSMVAGGWAETGQAQRALQILRDVNSRNPRQDIASRIQYAGLLLNTQQDAELGAVLRDIARHTDLTPKQFDDLNKIILALTLRQTDALREAGRLAEAFDSVSPALAQSNDPKLAMALARIYQSGGEPATALQLAEGVIAGEPDDLNNLLFAAGVAMAAKQLDKAGEYANAALALAPDHPRALAQVGRVEKLRGNTGKALEYFQYAQALEREKGAFANVPGNLALRLVDNTPATPALLGSPAAPRNQLLPLPNATRNQRAPELPGQIRPGGVLPLPGNRSGNGNGNSGNGLQRPFVDPLGSNAPTTGYAMAQSAAWQTTQQAVGYPVAQTASYQPESTAQRPAVPAATPAETIYQAAYQAALDSFAAKGSKSKKRRSKRYASIADSNTGIAGSSTGIASSDVAATLPGTASGVQDNELTYNKPGKRSRSSKRSKQPTQDANRIVADALAGLGSARSPAAGMAAPVATIAAVPDWRARNEARLPVIAPAAPLPSAPASWAPVPAAPLPASANNDGSRLTLQRQPLPTLASPGSGNIGNSSTNAGSSDGALGKMFKGLFGSGAATAAVTPAGSAANRERSISEEIAEIELKVTTTMDVAAAYRNRSGEIGMNQLSEIEVPLEFKTALDYDHTLTLRVTPVLLSAGTIILPDPAHATQFGSGPLGPFLASPYPAAEQEASGVGLALGLAGEHFQADIGTSPLGFKIRNVVGGFSLNNTVEDLTLKLSVNRRAVTDSVLSYAGARDPRTGNNWGGVVKTGIRLDAQYGEEQYGVYAGIGVAGLTGRDVKSNNEFEASIGGYMRAWQNLNHRVTLGLSLNALGYRYNLSHFTLGHGGYFSPQRYLSLSLPIDAAGRWGRLSYQLGIDGGFRHSTQDRVAYFPNDALAQQAWQTRIATTPPLAIYSAFYNGDNSSGFGLNFRATFEYLLAPKFALGGRFSFDNSRNYTQQTGLVYLRYAFTPLPQPVPFPPRSVTPLSLGEPL